MKKFLISIIIIFIAFAAFLVWLFEREGDGVPIFVYHQVNDSDHNQLTISTSDFEEQLIYLKENGYSFITPNDLLEAWDNDAPLPNKPIILTFDDGYVDMYKNVLPLLQKYEAKATLFIITDYINLYPNYLTWPQARELQQSGFVDIQSHTMSHFNLNDDRLSSSELRHQLAGSKQAIEWHIKKPAKFIAYPGGTYTYEVEEMTHEVGYSAAFIVDYGYSHKMPQHFVLPRIPIFGDNSYPLLRFKIRLLGAPILAPLSRLKNELIHDGNGMIADLIWLP